LRLHRHRRSAGPHQRSARPGARLPEGAGSVPPVWRLQPDRASELLWAAVRSLFWQGLAGDAAQLQVVQQLHVLQANFRNTQAVTQVANTLLKIKQAGFGSIDRERNFLVQSTAGEPGEVVLIQAKDAALKQPGP